MTFRRLRHVAFWAWAMFIGTIAWWGVVLCLLLSGCSAASAAPAKADRLVFMDDKCSVMMSKVGHDGPVVVEGEKGIISCPRGTKVRCTLASMVTGKPTDVRTAEFLTVHYVGKSILSEVDGEEFRPTTIFVDWTKNLFVMSSQRTDPRDQTIIQKQCRGVAGPVDSVKK